MSTQTNITKFAIINSLPCNILSYVSQEEDYEQWKLNRNTGIGGSEVGAICGISKFASPRSVYIRKTTGYDEDFDDNQKQSMEWGNLLEPVVAYKYMQETGRKVLQSPATLQHKQYPWALANIDRFIVDDNGVPYGILECKTADARMKDSWEEGEFYLSYMYQLVWYMWITGLPFGAIACVVGGNRFYYYEIFMDDELITNEILPKVIHFWYENVLKGVEPPLIGADSDIELVKASFPALNVVKNSEKTINGEVNDLKVERFLEVKAQLKELEKEKDELQNQLCELVGNSHIAYTLGHTLKWAPASRTQVPAEALRTKYPHIWEELKTTTHYRMFSAKPSLS